MDNFTDGEFTMNPTWIGDDSVFTIVNSSGNNQLRSDKQVASSSFYLATPSTPVTNNQWEFYTNLQFNTSSANFVDIYLCSDQANLLSGTINGYFVRIGGTTDEISLYRKVAGVATKIIDGADGICNVSNNVLKIKVTCSATNVWKLERDISGTGANYIQEGTITDATITTSSYFGISITQSTATFFQKHFFDDFYIGPIILDVTPPVLVSATPMNATQIDILFNEGLEQISAENTANYSLTPAISILNATLDGSNPALVHLTLAGPMSNGTTYTLDANAISDLQANISGIQSTQFNYLVAEIPQLGDVIINEFVCDESPSIGLPQVEYVEIYNKSSKYFNLQNWKLGDASTQGTLQSGWLYPGEYKVLCATANVDSFPVAIAVTSFPSLNNSGDNIELYDNTGQLLNKVVYDLSWYHDPSKEDGGYSIELINPNDPCSDSDNWRASEAILGGTPGSINSIYNTTADSEPAFITQLVALAPNFLEIYFSEGMDSTSLVNALITIDPVLTIQNSFVLSPHPTMMTLAFNENIVGSQNYTIELLNIADCWLNSADLTGVFALPEPATVGDLIINEILFDPYTGGFDWIEVYNNSDKLIDLKDWQLANFEDTIANHKLITSHFLVAAGEYAVIGKDSTFVKQNYQNSIPGTFVYSELPSYNNDSSTVYLIFNHEVIDKVSYAEDWHFKLLDNTDGVSLERIDPNGISDDRNNWHSAAEAIGFATPGAKNSQYYPVITNGDFNFTSQTISPDNDGFEDVLQISYSMSEPGLLGTFSIYDDRGRKIKQVFSNELLASNGVFTWDGVTDDEVKASIGTYVAVFEAYALNGGLMFTKTKAFVVAGKL